MQSRKSKGLATNDLKNTKDAKEETELKQKTKNEYVRIGLLVGIIIILAIISSLYIDAPKSCSSAVFSTQRNSCFQTEALSSHNASYCSEISDIGLQTDCFASVAESTANASICSSIPNPLGASTCISNVSISSHNESYCNLISNGSYRSECLYSFAKSVDFSNASLCSGITDSNLSYQCMSFSGYSDALSTGNPSYCSGLGTNATTDIPISRMFSSVSSNLTSEVPYSYLLNISDKGLCYYSVAVIYKNKTLCGNLSQEFGADCYASINTATKPIPKLNLTAAISECDSSSIYGGSLTVNACFTGFAVSYHNSTYCQPISNSTAKADCVSEVYNATNYTANSTTNIS